MYMCACKCVNKMLNCTFPIALVYEEKHHLGTINNKYQYSEVLNIYWVGQKVCSGFL